MLVASFPVEPELDDALLVLRLPLEEVLAFADEALEDAVEVPLVVLDDEAAVALAVDTAPLKAVPAA